MDDRSLVEAMAGGDVRGIEGAYRRYADCLYGYCRSLLHDPDAAADVLHDTFLIAGRQAGALRDPTRLKSWLYAIARNECLRALRARRRHVSWDESQSQSQVRSQSLEPAVDATDPGRAVHGDQLRELVATASAGLSDADREVVELSLRQSLEPGELAEALGVSANHAHARMSRARAALQRSIGALVVIRAGGERCPTLDDLLAGWDGTFNPLWRKRISRHIEDCSRCAEQQRALLNPADLLPAYAALPFLAVPPVVWARLEISQRSGLPGQSPGQPPGQPTRGPSMRGPSKRGAPRRGVPKRSLVVAAAVGLGLLGGGGVAWVLDKSEPAALTMAPSQPPPGLALLTATPSTSPADGATGPGTPQDLQTPGPGAPTTSPSQPPTTTPLDLGYTTLTVTAAGAVSCFTSGLFLVTVNAQASAPVSKVLLYWAAPATQRKAITLVGTTKGQGSTPPLFPEVVTWWVEVRTSDGRTATSTPRTVINPCN